MSHLKNSRTLLVLFAMGFLLLSKPGQIAASPTPASISASARAKGKLVADYYLAKNVLPKNFQYYDACSYYGACLYGAEIADTSYRKSIYDRYKKNMPGSISTGDVDKNSCAILPLHLFRLTKDSSLLRLGKASADASLKNDGYRRYAADDMYMTGSLMIQAYRATRDTAYLNFCAEYVTTYCAKLQQPSGLYWHRVGSKWPWGRGNGWAAASCTELLQELPPGHPKYKAVLDGYKKHMAGLLTVQKPSGMWMQLLGSDDSRNWEETSCTSMFLFAIFTGLEKGWLDETTFVGPAKKAWNALAEYVDSKGILRNVCVGYYGDGSESGYLTVSKSNTGDAHGVGAFLWAASAAIRLFASTPIRPEPVSSGQSLTPLLPCPGKSACFDMLGRTIQATGNTGRPLHPSGIFIFQQGLANKKTNCRTSVAIHRGNR
jgi:hypothetical protein